MRHTRYIGWLLAFSLGLAQQATRVDIRTQSKAVDFSAANATKPMKTGSGLPATCSPGEMFYKTDAAAGANVFGCTATNVWTVQGSVGAGGLPPMPGNSGKVLGTDGANAQWQGLAGDVSGTPGNITVTRLQNRTLSSGTPQAGQVLGWSVLANQWEPQNVSLGGTLAAWQLVDLAVTRSTPTTLTISPAAPYTVIGCGGSSTRLTNAATVTLAPGAGSGAVWIYYDCASARLTVGAALTNNGNLSCNANCTVAPGINAFPVNTVHLYSWTAGIVADQWDPAGGADWRQFVTTKVTRPGTNTVGIENPDGSTTLGVDTTVVPQWFTGAGVPSQNCSTGRDFYTDTAGQALYFCVATNVWKKASP